MIDLSGKTQAEIEKMFSNESVMETLQVNTEMFYAEVDDEDLVDVKRILKTDDIDDLMLYFLSLIGNPEMGYKVYEPIKGRAVKPDAVAKALANSRLMQDMFPEPTERYPIALNLVACLDEVFYDIVYIRTLITDDQWRMISNCIVQFDIDMSTAVVAELEMVKFPLIDNPKDWKANESGGYHTNEGKSTLNRGSAKQPQNCLDVLNTLQQNRFELVGENIQDLQDYIYTKQLIKYGKFTAGNITKNITVTADEVFQTMKKYEFMFQWNFDFRGRLYSRGYDINLQSDKYRKGIIVPCISNFKEKS